MARSICSKLVSSPPFLLFFFFLSFLAAKPRTLPLDPAKLNIETTAVRFAATDVTRRSPHRRTRLGIGRTFQHSSLFDDLPARENIAMSAQRKLGHAYNAVLPTARLHDVDVRSNELLGLVGLDDLGDEEAGSLSYGHRRQLEVALALATEPRLLLLDEPSLGLAPSLVDDVFSTLADIREGGFAVLLVEQRAQRTVALADRTHVLANGELRLTLGPADAGDTEKMVAAYFAG